MGKRTVVRINLDTLPRDQGSWVLITPSLTENNDHVLHMLYMSLTAWNISPNNSATLPGWKVKLHVIFFFVEKKKPYSPAFSCLKGIFSGKPQVLYFWHLNSGTAAVKHETNSLSANLWEHSYFGVLRCLLKITGDWFFFLSCLSLFLVQVTKSRPFLSASLLQ